MEIIKNRLRHFGQLQTGTDLLEESQSILIPDTCPDVLQIVGTDGWLNIQEKSCSQGTLRISGQVNCNICYLSTEGKTLYAVAAVIPFSFTEEVHGMDGEDRLLSAVKLLSVSAVMLNPRKLVVKSQLQLVTKLYKQQKNEYTEEIRQGEVEGIYALQEKCSMQYIADIVEKRLVLSDEIRLSSDLPNEQSLILCKHCTWICEDVKLLQGKIMLRGRIDAAMTALDHDGAYIGKSTYSIPFSQIIECDSVAAEDNVMVSFSPVREEITLSTGADGVTTMYFSFAAVTECLIQKQRDLVMVQDAYSTKWETKTTSSELASPAEGAEHQMQISVRETILLDNSTAQILGAVVVPETAVLQKGEHTLGTAFHGTVIYKEDDGTVMTVSKRFYVEANLPETVQTPALCTSAVHEPAVAVTGEGEVELTFEALLTCKEELGPVHPAIEGCTVEPIARKRMEGSPSLIVRSAQQGESVWGLAKIYGTAPDVLASANKLEPTDLFPSGRLVLIPFISR